MSIHVDEWSGCYRRGWGKELVPEAFAHPAKISFALAERIYAHMLEEGWLVAGMSVLDPFGGVAGTAYHALKHGLIWTGVELESRFVALGQANIDLWNHRYAGRFRIWGRARLLRGDSRRLLAVMREADGCVSSPPYSADEKHDHTYDQRDDRRGHKQGRGSFRGQYGKADGKLAAMPAGDALVSSPPFRQTTGGTGVKPGVIPGSPTSDPRLIERHSASNMAAHGYGESAGNLANMPDGGWTAALSSPPYAGAEVGNLGNYKGPAQLPDGVGDLFKAAGGDHQNYGDTAGQLGSMPAGDASVSSLPYEANDQRGGHTQVAADKRVATHGYGEALGNIGNAQGETFWSASKIIVEQTYLALRPGAHAVWIVKNYVRDGAIVPFTDQWAALCESVGFVTLHEHHALLTERRGTQLAHDGQHKNKDVKRISFFRRLHEKKHPETAILYETVLCMERP